MVKIGVTGALGRMGSRILALAKADAENFQIVHAFEVSGSPVIGKISGEAPVILEDLLPYADGKKKLACDVLIDFTGPDGADWAVSAASAASKKVVIGSTGLSEETLQKIKTASSAIPLVVSSNMSIGVNLVIELLELLAKKAPDNFDIEITEAHHRHKKDAPSGTALMMADAIAKAKGWNIKEALAYRCEGKTGERPQKEIGMQVIRAGEIIGDHTALFAGPAETIEITHKAQSRDTFARGALLAALFVSKKTNGLYSMRDVLK